MLKLKIFNQREKNFMLTYGDGLTNQNIKKLEKFHLRNNKTATMTIVRPPVRFGEVKTKGLLIMNFKEKTTNQAKLDKWRFFCFQ